jgi:pimeloyl-ACP methyl ester carboxylesterase
VTADGALPSAVTRSPGGRWTTTHLSVVRWRSARELGGQGPPGLRRPPALSSTVLALLVAVTSVGCTADTDQVRAAAFEPRLAVDPECFGLDTGGLRTEDVTCATVTVPLRHDDPAAGTIDLAVAVLPGRQADEFVAPSLLLGGGPGGAMVEPFLTSLGRRMAYDVGPDLIVLDQRGVGLSEPALDCPELGELGLEADAAEDPSAALTALGACRERLHGAGIDLDAFDHLANARDIDLVRRALDQDLVDVRAVSYGTFLALLAANERPAGIRSLILDSPVDPSMTVHEEALASDEMARKLADRCGDETDCLTAVGDLEHAIEGTIARLANQSDQVTVIVGHKQLTVTVGPDRFAHQLFTFAYDPDDIALLPAAVHRAHEGDLGPLLRLTLQPDPGDGAGMGMHYAMMCSSTPKDLDAQLAASQDGSRRLVTPLWLTPHIQELCEVWEVDVTLDPGNIELDIAIPTLLVTGGLDLITPPEHGERVHASLPASQLLEIPAGVHGPLERLGPCGRRIAADFLRNPDAPVEATCALEHAVTFAPELPARFGGSASG